MLLDDGDALVAVNAFYNDNNKLTADFNTACSASYDKRVYLFGAGANSDDILTYHSDSDNFETLEENYLLIPPSHVRPTITAKFIFSSAKTFLVFRLARKSIFGL